MKDMSRFPEFKLGLSKDTVKNTYRILVSNLNKLINIDTRILSISVNESSKKYIMGLMGDLSKVDSTYAVCEREILYLHTPIYDNVSNITYFITEREQLGSKYDGNVLTGAIIRSVYDFTLNTTKYNYEANMSISANGYFSYQMEKGFIEINDNPEKWAVYNPNRVYNVNPKENVVYIFEGINGVVDRTYTGFVQQKTFVKRTSKNLDTIKLAIRDKFYLWEEIKFEKSMSFEDTYPKQFFKELLKLEDNEIYYANGTVEDDYPRIQSLNTKEYDKYSDLFRDYANSGVRFAFDSCEKLKLFSDTINENIVSFEEFEINETINITDINETSNNQLIYNDIDAEVKHRRPYKNIDEFGGKDNIQYVRFLGNPININHTLVRIEDNIHRNSHSEIREYAIGTTPNDYIHVSKHYDTPVVGTYSGQLQRVSNSKVTKVLIHNNNGTNEWVVEFGYADKAGGTMWNDIPSRTDVNTEKTSYSAGTIIMDIEKYKPYIADGYEYVYYAVNTSTKITTYYSYYHITHIGKKRRQLKETYNYTGTLTMAVKDKFVMNMLSVVNSELMNAVNYGDYVLMKDNRQNQVNKNEFYGRIADIHPKENKVDIIFGNFDKDYRLLYKGKFDWFVGNGYDSQQNFTLHYGKIEMPIVWKYARNFSSGTRDYDLNYPILPQVVDGDNKFENIKELYGTFSFADDLKDEAYAGYCVHMDRIYSRLHDDGTFDWWKGDKLRYNRELEQFSDLQSPPIFLLSNSIDSKDGKNGDNDYLKYTYYDNRNIEIAILHSNEKFLNVGAKKSDMEKSDVIIKIRNSNVIQKSDIHSEKPVDMMGYLLLEIADRKKYHIGDVIRLKKVDKIKKPVGSDYTEDEIVQNEMADFYSNYSDLLWTIVSVFTNENGKHYIQLNQEYPSAITKTKKYYFEFEQFKYDKITFVQELYFRGNPVVEKSEQVTKTNYESIKRFEKQGFTVNAPFLYKEDVFKLVDYFHQNFNGLTRETTKIKIPMSIWYGSLYLEKLDVITFRDLVITGVNHETKWMVSKKTQSDIELINISKYSGDSDNVVSNETPTYAPEKLPEYTHTGGEGGVESQPDTSNKVINENDDRLGTLGLVEIPMEDFSAYVLSYENIDNDGSSDKYSIITFTDIAGSDNNTIEKYSNLFFKEAGVEFIVKIDGEMVQVRTVYPFEYGCMMMYRSLFGTTRTNIRGGQLVQFYNIASKINEHGLYTQSLLVGNESGNHMKYKDGKLTVVSDDVDIKSGNINIENIQTGDKIRILSHNKFDGEPENELLIGTSTGSRTNLQLGNASGNFMLRMNDTNSEIFMGQKEGTYQFNIGNTGIAISDILNKFNGQYSREEILNNPVLLSSLSKNEQWRLKNYQKYMYFNGDIFQLGSNVEIRGLGAPSFGTVDGGINDMTFDQLGQMYMQNKIGLTQFSGNLVSVFQNPSSPQRIVSLGYMDASLELEPSEFVRIGKNAVPVFSDNGNRTSYNDGLWIGDSNGSGPIDSRDYLSYDKVNGLKLKGDLHFSSGERVEDVIENNKEEINQSMIKTWYSQTPPVGANDGDLWFKTATILYEGKEYQSVNIYRYSKSTKEWIQVEEDAVSEIIKEVTFANNEIVNIFSDNKLTPNEKQDVSIEIDSIKEEKKQLESQVNNYGKITSTEYVNYNNSYNELTTYITPVISNLTTTSDIVGTTMKTKFLNYYNNKQILLTFISKLVKTNTDSALGQLTDIADDGKLTANEKIQAKKEWDVIVSENPSIVSQCTIYKILDSDTKKSAYTKAYNDLNTYLNGSGGILTNMNITSTIDRTLFMSKFNKVYETRESLLSLVVQKSKEYTQTKIKTYIYSTFADLVKNIDAENVSIGDLWYSSSKLKLHRYIGGGVTAEANWEMVSSQNTSDMNDDAEFGKNADWEYIEGNGKPSDNATNTVMQNRAPNNTTDKGKNINDEWIWKKADDTVDVYYWNGTSWISYITSSEKEALDKIVDTQTKLDKEMSFFYGSVPTGVTPKSGDILVTQTILEGRTVTKMSEYKNGSWVEVTDKTGYEALLEATLVDSKVNDIFSDNKLTPDEKRDVSKEFENIKVEYTNIIQQCSIYKIPNSDTSKTTFESKYNSLSSYITPLLSNMTTTSDIVGNTFKVKFVEYYTAREIMLTTISRKSNDNTTSALSSISDMSSDSKLTPVEKLSTKKEWEIIVSEKPNIDSQSLIYGLNSHSSKLSYDSAYNALNTYLNNSSDGLLSNMINTSNIVRNTFIAKFKDYYDKKELLMKFITERAKEFTSKKTSVYFYGTFAELSTAITNGTIENIAIGDMWYNTQEEVIYGYRGPTSTVESNWRIVSSLNTSDIKDDAGLGSTADWDKINNAPSVNYIPNETFSEGLSNWSYSYENKDVANIIPDNNIFVDTNTDTYGGTVLHVKSHKSIYSGKAIAIDVNKIYKLEIRLRVDSNGSSGNGTLYCGVATLDYNFKNLTGGAGTHRYCTLGGASLNASDGWKTYVGYISGIGANHNQFRSGTCYVRPMAIWNYTNGNASYSIDYIKFSEILSEEDIKNGAGWDKVPDSGATNNSEEIHYANVNAEIKLGKNAFPNGNHGIYISAGKQQANKKTEFSIDSVSGDMTLDSWGKLKIQNSYNLMYFDNNDSQSANRSRVILNSSNNNTSDDTVFKLGNSLVYTKNDTLSLTNGIIRLVGSTSGKNYELTMAHDRIESVELTGTDVQKFTRLQGGDVFFKQGRYESRANIKMASGTISSGNIINLRSDNHSKGVAWENPQVLVYPVGFRTDGANFSRAVVALGNDQYRIDCPSDPSSVYQYFAFESIGSISAKYGIGYTNEQSSQTQDFSINIGTAPSKLISVTSDTGSVSRYSISGSVINGSVTGGSAYKSYSTTYSYGENSDYNTEPSASRHWSGWLGSPFGTTYSGTLYRSGGGLIYPEGSGFVNYSGQPSGEDYRTGTNPNFVNGSIMSSYVDGTYEYANVATETTRVYDGIQASGYQTRYYTYWVRRRRRLGKSWIYSGSVTGYSYRYTLTYIYE